MDNNTNDQGVARKKSTLKHSANSRRKIRTAIAAVIVVITAITVFNELNHRDIIPLNRWLDDRVVERYLVEAFEGVHDFVIVHREYNRRAYSTTAGGLENAPDRWYTLQSESDESIVLILRIYNRRVVFSTSALLPAR